MCSLCSVLGPDNHWTDAVARERVYTRNHSDQGRRRERTERIRMTNVVLRLYGLVLEDWQAKSYILRTSTGKCEIIDGLSHLWVVAERMSGRRIDPLRDDFVDRLRRVK